MTALTRTRSHNAMYLTDPMNELELVRQKIERARGFSGVSEINAFGGIYNDINRLKNKSQQLGGRQGAVLLRSLAPLEEGVQENIKRLKSKM